MPCIAPADVTRVCITNASPASFRRVVCYITLNIKNGPVVEIHPSSPAVDPLDKGSPKRVTTPSLSHGWWALRECGSRVPVTVQETKVSCYKRVDSHEASRTRSFESSNTPYARRQCTIANCFNLVTYITSTPYVAITIGRITRSLWESVVKWFGNSASNFVFTNN